MKFLQRSQGWLFVWLMIASTGWLRAQSYTSVVVFGDSLSDTGNVANVTAGQFGVRYPGVPFNYADGRFTDSAATSPAAKAYSGVWVEQLAAQFAAKPAVKDSLDGGTNYAYGDATTANGTHVVSGGPGVTIQVADMGQQVTNYLASNTANATALYILFGGANDIYADSSTASATAAAQRETALVQRLVDAGARNFLVPNLPPLGNAPAYVGGPTAAALNAASATFRVMLASDLQALNTAATLAGRTLQIFQPDIYTQSTAAATNPMSYGLVNVTSSAQGLTTVNPDTYAFWDSVHPTTTGHHLIAAAAENLLTPLVASTTTLTITPGATLAGQAVTLKAVVTGTGPAAKASGQVTFFNGTGSSATLLASAVLDATGTATASFTGTVAGSPYSITAVYSGDLAYLNSSSTAQTLSVVVTPVATTTTLTSSNATANLGAAVTFTATVASANGTPAGTVTFFDGSTSLGTATLSGTGVGTFMTSTLAAGSHTITAVYAAGGIFAGSTSNAVTEVVTAPSVTVTFSPATLTVQHGGTGSTTVTLTPVGGAAGTVTLSCGTLPAHASCGFTPSTVTLSGTTPQTSTLTIGTTATSALEMPGMFGRGGHGGAIFAVLILPLFGVRAARRQRWMKGLGAVAGLLLLGMLTVGVTGCGGAAASTTTAAGTYSVVVTATVSGATTATSQGTLTVVVQ